ncbi:MAG: aminotransferase [Sphingobium sp.]
MPHFPPDAPGHPVYRDMEASIFERMSALARETGAINLGQGFPDAPGPTDVLAAAAEALLTRSNQYPPMAGLPELREAVAAHYAAHQGLGVEPADIVVTAGATEAIAASLLALIQPGDEVLVFAPLYDAYLPLIARAGGVAKVISLPPPDWRITAQALAQAIGPRTRFMIVNSPNNPTGVVLDDETLALLAQTCLAYDLIAICDEVWEHVTKPGVRHRSLMTLPGMAARTVKIGSAGKIFALTGWKVGWACAAQPLARLVMRAHQYLSFTTPPNLQWAVAQGLSKPADWFEDQRGATTASRDRLVGGLTKAGFVLLPASATWFVLVDLPASGIMISDIDFCERSAREAGVAAVPISTFYPADPVAGLVRLCFTKSNDVLDEAVARLAAFRQRLL